MSNGYIFQGMSSLGDDAAAGLAMIGKRRDQTKALRQVLKSYAPTDAQGKFTPEGQALVDHAESMGLPDLEGYVQGMAVKSAQAKAAADIAKTKAETDYYADMGTARKSQENDALSTAKALRLFYSTEAAGAPAPTGYGPLPSTGMYSDMITPPAAGPVAAPGGPSVDQRLQYVMSRMPQDASFGRTWPQVMSTIMKYGAGGENDFSRRAVAVQEGQLKLAEDKFAEEKGKDYTDADFKLDAQGNPTHWRVGNSWVKWNPALQIGPGSKPGTVRVFSPQAQPLAGLFTGANITPGNGGASAPELSGTPKVTTQAQFDALPSGAQYIGKNGQTYQKP